MMRRMNVIAGALLLLFLAGCQASEVEPGAAGTATAEDAVTAPAPSPTEQAPDPAPGEEELPSAVQAARQELATAHGEAIEAVDVSGYEAMDWPNACLGLEEEGEICAAVVTPGFRATMEVAGHRYEVRTDQTGQVVRWQEIVEAGGEFPATAIRAREALADRLGADASEVQILDFERREWANGCLELAGPEELCTQVLVPGWLVLMQVGEQRYEAHTDNSGDRIRLAEEGSTVPLPEEGTT